MDECPDPVELRREGSVATLILNRPSQANALDVATVARLHEHARNCADDPSIRCVVLTGAGKSFCAGGDVSAFSDNADDLGGYLGNIIAEINASITVLMRMDKPLICLVNGAAAGAGLSLALMGDVVIAGRSASFMAAYGGVGLTPDGGLSWMLPRLVGMRKAQEMIIANRLVTADDAEQMGLITSVVDDEELAESGAKQAARLAKSATNAIGAARKLLLSSTETTFEEQLERERQAMMAAGAGEEAREGVGAFLARRKPDFEGSN